MAALMRGVGLVTVVLLGLAGVFAWWLVGTLPHTRGEIRIEGLTNGIAAIRRDSYGIPAITAHSDHDAYFALGFAHAQDRLWQMELQRRAVAGRLAEILGPKALPSDRFMRTLGLYRSAESSFTTLSPKVQAALRAYASGVNAFITRNRPPPEFLLLRCMPEPWMPADSLAFGKLMALQLSGNWQDELLRQRLASVLSPDQLADLWPAPVTGDPVTIGLAPAAIDALLAAIPPIARPRLASNIWVLSGRRTTTGKPFLANDPHLAFQTPILWYLARIDAPDLHVAGATVPGVPFHLIGHNDDIAWGMTATSSDTIDLFVEKPAGDGYETPDGLRPFIEHRETILVRNHSPVTLTVRETRHGPVISDLLGERAHGQILAMSAALLAPADHTAQALYRLNRAADWADFEAALADFDAPQQNIGYADRLGHIGMISPGRVPIRKAGDGTLPRPGWTGAYDWTGWIPYASLPRLLDPPSGMVINANNRLVGPSHPYLLTADWPDGYRALRIKERLEAMPHASMDDMEALQMDETSLMAREITPLLLRVPPTNDRATAIYRRLAAWDGEMNRNRPEPLIFEAWLVELQGGLLRSRLGELAKAFPVPRPAFLKSVLEGHTAWCGPPDKPAPADCAVAVAKALDRALDALDVTFGGNADTWRWGRAHKAIFPATLLSHLPLLDCVTRTRLPTGGGDFTVQRGSFTTRRFPRFDHVHGAGLRAVFDLADPPESRYIVAPGQSGNFLSSHWSDLTQLWRDGRLLTLPPHLADGGRVLILEPKR